MINVGLVAAYLISYLVLPFSESLEALTTPTWRAALIFSSLPVIVQSLLLILVFKHDSPVHYSDKHMTDEFNSVNFLIYTAYTDSVELQSIS